MKREAGTTDGEAVIGLAVVAWVIASWITCKRSILDQ